MKKTFFIALAAVFTVGAAILSSQAATYVGDDNVTYTNCNGISTPLCTSADFPPGVLIRPQSNPEAPFAAPEDVLTDSDFRVQ